MYVALVFALACMGASFLFVTHMERQTREQFSKLLDRIQAPQMVQMKMFEVPEAQVMDDELEWQKEQMELNKNEPVRDWESVLQDIGREKDEGE